MKVKSKYIIAISIIIVFIIIDQLSKIYAISKSVKEYDLIPNILQIDYIENTGGAFGVGQGNIPTFIITNLIVLGIIIRFIILQIESIDIKTLISLSVILSGGFSNFFDRIFRGFVVDFIRIFPQINLPIINIADICITIRLDFVSVFICKTDIFRNKERKKRR